MGLRTTNWDLFRYINKMELCKVIFFFTEILKKFIEIHTKQYFMLAVYF